MIRIADPQPPDDGPYESRGRFVDELEYTGRFDADAELHVEQGRWYDPTLAVWMNDDVVGFADDVNL